MKHVDIVLISWAKDNTLKQVTDNAIFSLINEDSDVVYHIYIVESNHSVRYEELSNIIGKLPHTIETIHPDVPFGYHRYLNIGRKAGTSEYVCLCNNDLIFDRNWANYIMSLMSANPDILSASPWCPQTQGDNAKHLEKAYIGNRVRGELAGWCIFQQRKIYDIIGDLDERFEFWYADNDYSMTLQHHNIKHALVPASIVHHHKSNLGKTGETLDSDTRKEYTSNQQKVFLDKWGK